MKLISKKLLRIFQMKHNHLTEETKGTKKDDIVTILKDSGGLYWSEPIHHRMKRWEKDWLRELEWKEKKIVEGRFLGSSLQYIPKEEIPVYYNALTPKIELNLQDKAVLDFIEENGPILKDMIFMGLSFSKKAIEKSMHKLDLAFEIIRTNWSDTKTWGEPVWDTTKKWLKDEVDLKSITEIEAKEKLILKFINTNGVLNLEQIIRLFKKSLNSKELISIIESLKEKKAVLAGSFIEDLQGVQYTTAYNLSILNSGSLAFKEDIVSILSYNDPFIRIWQNELLRLFGKIGPSASGPAWLSYILFNEEPIGIVDYKWRVKTSEIRNLGILFAWCSKKTLAMVIETLEKEAKWMGHKEIKIYCINSTPSKFSLDTPQGKALISNGYMLKDENFIKCL